MKGECPSMDNQSRTMLDILNILSLRKVHTVHTVKSAIYLKWSVGFENDMKITPIFTITFSSKMLIKQCFTSLEHIFLGDGLNLL